MLITARWLLPVLTPPIRDGAVLIKDGTIRELGTRKWFAKRDVSDVIDLGETILVPGFVNAHCHLEHSALGKVASSSPPRLPFSTWVRAVQEAQPKTSKEETAKGFQRGIDELIRGGTTTLVDHRSPAADLPVTPFREFIILEVLGASLDRARASFCEAGDRLEKQDPDRACEISPHSLYAVHQEVLKKLPIRSVHLLESEEEDQFFRHGKGPLADLVRERGGELPFPESSPVRWLGRQNPLPERPLIVHGNYLTGEEIRLLRDLQATVIHCPESWRFFGHRRLPIQSLFYNEIRIAIGTDSLASSDSLSMLRQLKLMKRTYPSLGEEDLLRMATFNGARALGWENEIGVLEAGKQADLVGIPLLKADVDPYEALLLADEVNFSMMGGRIVKCTNRSDSSSNS